MIKFIHNYGLWILLALVFLAMFLFGLSSWGSEPRRALQGKDKTTRDKER